MKRWWLLSAVGAVSALVILQLTRPEATSPPPSPDAAPDTAEAQPSPAVQVEHVLVHADVVRTESRQAESRPAEDQGSPMLVGAGGPVGTNAWTSPAPARSARPHLDRVEVTTTPPPLFERAKRAFLGDGRHRPEPFPRIKDN